MRKELSGVMQNRAAGAAVVAALLLTGCHSSRQNLTTRPSQSSDAAVIAAARSNPKLSPLKKQQIIMALSGPPDPYTGQVHIKQLYDRPTGHK